MFAPVRIVDCSGWSGNSPMVVVCQVNIQWFISDDVCSGSDDSGCSGKSPNEWLWLVGYIWDDSFQTTFASWEIVTFARVNISDDSQRRCLLQLELPMAVVVQSGKSPMAVVGQVNIQWFVSDALTFARVKISDDSGCCSGKSPMAVPGQVNLWWLVNGWFV